MLRRAEPNRHCPNYRRAGQHASHIQDAPYGLFLLQYDGLAPSTDHAADLVHLRTSNLVFLKRQIAKLHRKTDERAQNIKLHVHIL